MSPVLQNILLAVIYLVFPALVIHYAGKFLFLKKAGNVVVVYFFGIIFGNLGILNQNHAQLQELFSSVSILLSLPLLLVGLNFSSWTKMAPKTFVSMLLGIFAVVFTVVLGFFIFRNVIPESWKISGMLIGVYMGGTPNLASIKEALKVDAYTYLMVHTSDLIFSGAYLLILISFGKVLLKKWLPYGFLYRGRFNNSSIEFSQNEDYTYFFKSYNLKPSLGLLLVSVVIFLFSYVISTLVPEKFSTMIIILLITTLGIVISFVPTLRRVPKSFELGMYLILVFSFVVASMADMSKISLGAMPIFLFVSYVITVTFLIHALLAKIFKVDADTLIITSTALICSPAFVPMMAGSLNNRSIILGGLTVGIIGYAIGNYLGIFTALLLSHL